MKCGDRENCDIPPVQQQARPRSVNNELRMMLAGQALTGILAHASPGMLPNPVTTANQALIYADAIMCQVMQDADNRNRKEDNERR